MSAVVAERPITVRNRQENMSMEVREQRKRRTMRLGKYKILDRV